MAESNTPRFDAYNNAVDGLNVIRTLANVSGNAEVIAIVDAITEAVGYLYHGDQHQACAADSLPIEFFTAASVPADHGYPSCVFGEEATRIMGGRGLLGQITDVTGHRAIHDKLDIGCPLCHARNIINVCLDMHNAIRAIKMLRQFTNGGLKECKDAVEAYARARGTKFSY